MFGLLVGANQPFTPALRERLRGTETHYRQKKHLKSQIIVEQMCEIWFSFKAWIIRNLSLILYFLYFLVMSATFGSQTSSFNKT